MNYERRIRFGGGGPGCGLLAGVWLSAIGAVLISPVGEWIIKGIGWLLLGIGVAVVVLTVVGWLTGRRRDGPRDGP